MALTRVKASSRRLRMMSRFKLELPGWPQLAILAVVVAAYIPCAEIAKPAHEIASLREGRLLAAEGALGEVTL